MIFWNERTLKSIAGSWIWNISEYFHIGLGKYVPIVFGWMIESKGKKQNKS